MIGVIHLSEAYCGLRLCEAIIHEFHHNELFVLEATQRLAAPDEKAIYYSPWRPDPRPLSGLLHALHVFSGIVRFFEKVESSAQEDFDRGEVHRSRSEFCQKLRIGVSQVPQQSLTSLGKSFLQELEDDLTRQARELGLRPERVSDAIAAHARTWCHQNPDYVEHLHWPGGVRELIDC
jgi:HEXXH motif-containing protein